MFGFRQFLLMCVLWETDAVQQTLLELTPFGADDEFDELPPIPDEPEMPGSAVARGASLRQASQRRIAHSGPHGVDAASDGTRLAEDFYALRHDLPPPIKEARRVRWVHIPKCGSSFGGALYRYACGKDPNPNWTKDEHFQRGDPKPGEPCGRWHDYNMQSPLGSNHSEDDLSVSAPFSMFRDPLKRQISAMKYANCSWSLCAPGFQTKFTLGSTAGFGWQSGREVKWADVQPAIEAVRNNFSFVGLTDDWDVSMILFHGMFGTTLRADDMLNARNTKYDQTQFLAIKQQLHEKRWRDPFDSKLVAEVKQLMKERITQLFSNACTTRPDNHVCIRLKPWFLDQSKDDGVAAHVSKAKAKR